MFKVSQTFMSYQSACVLVSLCSRNISMSMPVFLAENNSQGAKQN